MSNKKVVGSQPLGKPMDGRAIYEWQIRNLEGKILTFIESLGLRESQEKSAKDIFKELFYRDMYQETAYIYGELLQPAIFKSKEMQDNGVGIVGDTIYVSNGTIG